MRLGACCERLVLIALCAAVDLVSLVVWRWVRCNCE